MVKEKLFGTDGVRGVANESLTAILALQLGMAAGHWVRNQNIAPKAEVQEVRRRGSRRLATGEMGISGLRPFVIIGRDTRISGDMLEAALAAGLAAMGVDVVNIGVAPTPAIAQIVLSRGASAGVVISASHNPYPDNGIKFFGPNGKKLPDAVEAQITAALKCLDSLPHPTGGDIGRVVETAAPLEDYVDRVLATLRGSYSDPLGGLQLVMDCANGAATHIAPRIFSEVGAELTVIHADPDGVNINLECGSTKPADLAAKVLETGAQAGLAFDGDADRVILADEMGKIVDGDRMMAIIAAHLKQRGELTGDTVVATIMSNVGLEQALSAQGIKLHRTDVGDRFVAEAMESLGAALGGEQSGHILLPGLTPTGDGLITALQVLMVMKEQAVPLSQLAGVVKSCPQLLKSIPVRTQIGWRDDPEIKEAVRIGEKRLGSPEWLSVRPSGTELLIRVMAQGTDKEVVESVVQDISAVVQKNFGRN